VDAAERTWAVSATHSEATLARLLVVDWDDEAAFDYRGSRMQLMGE
jgi:hypothetical protein